MDIELQKSQPHQNSEIRISGSKSETNRLLLLQALFPNIEIQNASDSDDSAIMQQALTSDSEVIDVHHAGTAMRFLTAYFAVQPGRIVTITGSDRMQQRPIKVLVDALRTLGADIAYANQEGFPPLIIKGKKLSAGDVAIDANVSSQYISALLMIGAVLPNGLSLKLEGRVTSVPYIKLTLALLQQVGIESEFTGTTIRVFAAKPSAIKATITVESDWSSASYFYSVIALSAKGTSIQLSSYKKDSLQGDSKLGSIYSKLGVETIFGDGTITLTNTGTHSVSVNLNLNESPDIAQTIAVTCVGLGISCELTGLHTLRIKETDRLVALQTELSKLGAAVTVTDESLTLDPAANLKQNVSIATYNDHRMAMAFAPLAIKVPIIIEDSAVVSKSYPGFWDDLRTIGFQFS